MFRDVYGLTLATDRMRPLERSLAGVLDRLLAELQTFDIWTLGDEPQ